MPMSDDDRQIADMEMGFAIEEHLDAMKAEIEATGECSIPPRSFIDSESMNIIMEGLRDDQRE